MKQDSNGRRSAILSLGTAVPPYCVSQEFVGNWITESLGDQPALQRWIKRLYRSTGIETRYTCLPDGQYPPSVSRYAPGRCLGEASTTSERMQVYEQASVEVGTQAAQRALDDYSAACGCTPEEAAGEITHLLAVSCTGFFAPGLDQMIVRGLNLSPTVERTLIGFMGCAAAFNALRLATQIVQAQPSARVLVVCVELCSIHIQPSLERVDLVGGAVFCDGAAACVVGMPQPTQRDVFEIAAFHTELTPETESFMVWKIGDHGYTLHLSAEVPSNLARVGPLALQKLLGASAPTMDFWAIHPGGRAILDGLETIFELTPHDMEPSRAVLRDYGNMSSPTILFVLQAHRERLRRNTANELTHGVMMAFGPGLVTEMAHLLYAPPCVEVSAAGAA